MLIDWFTVAAQVLNFVVLVWLLKRFLYRPILNAIDAREKRVAAELADADATRVQARAERDAFTQKNEALNAQRDAMMKRASDEAAEERRKLIEDARQTAADMRARSEAALKKDMQSASQSIREAAAHEVLEIARKALADLADTELDARVADVFIRRLRSLSGDERETFVLALKAADETLLRSAFELPSAQIDAIASVLKKDFAVVVRMRHEVDPTLLGGIELSAGGRKVSWSIADYLSALEEKVSARLEPPRTPDAQT